MAVPAFPVRFERKPRPFDRVAAAREYERLHPEAVANRIAAARRAVAGTRLRVFATDPASFFAQGLSQILATRMAGLPIINPTLNVSALPFKRIQDKWLGVAVTPWSIQAIIACADRTTWRFFPAGSVITERLPGGEFSFLSVVDSILGHYRMCSLKSPVFDIADQTTAEAFAKIALDLLCGIKKIQEPQQAEGISLVASPVQDPNRGINWKTPVNKRDIVKKMLE